MESFAPSRRRRFDRWLAGLYLLAVFAIGCSTQETTTPASSAPTAAAPPSDVAEGNLSGLWTGTTSTGGYLGMAGKTRKITLVIRQAGDKLTGSYRCSAGNSLCRNGDNKGSITGTAKGTQVNLNITLLPDASNCRYTGTLDYNGNGSYTCYGQGQIVEQGNWEATR